MASFFVLPNQEETFAVGDYVVYVRDGARGVVYCVEGNRYQILWEDHFVSWEEGALLRRME